MENCADRHESRQCAAIVLKSGDLPDDPAQCRGTAAMDRIRASKVVGDQGEEPRVVEKQILLVFARGTVHDPGGQQAPP